MRCIVNGITAACIVLLCDTSSAEPLAIDESRQWVPSLALTSGMLVGGARGEVASTVRPSATGTEGLIISPWLGGSLEIMTPSWEPLGERTRFFVHGGLAGNFGFERDLAKEGNPDTFVAPTIPAFGDEALVQGQGSVTRAEPTDFQASAGIGLSVTIDTEWRRIRIKPSLEYLVEEIEISGLVHRATSDDPAIPSFNFFAISGADEKFFHSIGPGLEVEADVARTGPLLLALTTSGGAYHILGDRDVEFSSTDATGAESAAWRYRREAWTYRFQVGLRLRWAPDVDRSP
jgi:hypothetical protein